MKCRVKPCNDNVIQGKELVYKCCPKHMEEYNKILFSKGIDEANNAFEWDY